MLLSSQKRKIAAFSAFYAVSLCSSYQYGIKTERDEAKRIIMQINPPDVRVGLLWSLGYLSIHDYFILLDTLSETPLETESLETPDPLEIPVSGQTQHSPT
jgi:hypothetical protein